MRSFFILLTGLILTQATISKAENQELDRDGTTSSATESEDAGDWTRWTCVATRTFSLKLYPGSSYHFRLGSGEEQDAKRVAQKIAVRACEVATNATCTSLLDSCQVESKPKELTAAH